MQPQKSLDLKPKSFKFFLQLTYACRNDMILTYRLCLPPATQARKVKRAMPNNVGDVSVVPATFKRISFRFIDISGDKISHSIQVSPTITLAQIQALAVAVGAATNASLYAIENEDVWAVVPTATNAVDATKSNSVKDHIIAQYKNAGNQSERVYVPAPVGGAFVADTDNVDPADALITALKTAVDAILSSYTAVGYRFNETREINSQVAI